MSSDVNAPGLRVRQRRDGPAYYWVASAVTRQAKGFPVKTVRLHYATEGERAAKCRHLTGELREWLASNGRAPAVEFRGTVASLIDCYQADEDSPYRKVREITRTGYDQDLRLLKAGVGSQHVGALTRKDFSRWHTAFAAPKETEGENGEPVYGLPRIRRAHGLMTMLRILFGYGKSMRFAGCREAVEVLEEMRFETPAARVAEMTFAQAEAIVDKALALGLRSIALGQALQFDLGIRQADVIGIWERAEAGASGIAYRNSRWRSGVLWSDIDADQVLRKKTSKTGALGEWHLPGFRLVRKALAAFPASERVGPLVIDEATGRPYKRHRYSRVWRTVADAAGVPRTVWNRDSRAGAITEGSEAGAAPHDLQRMATHADQSTTERYIRRSKDASGRVAVLREEKRLREQTKK